jgi:A/G-specific adenine glycosylase
MDSPLPPLASQAAAFRQHLLAWYHRHRRTLPWREEPSLYKTVVSEFMLQQTQIKTALPYFHRWLQRFPDFAHLAAADETEVVKAWEGLGYYSRARNLHRLARAVVARSTPPSSAQEWRELPGIGPYTAAAITSIALQQPNACVDGNVVRILARLVGEDRLFRDSSQAATFFTPLADALLAPEAPGDHNQAMMELGATVCHRQSPLCMVCPVLSFCTAARTHRTETLPRLAAKKIEQIAVNRLWCREGSRLLLHRTPAQARRLANLYELPDVQALGIAATTFAQWPVLAQKKRSITRYQIAETIAQAPATEVHIPIDRAADYCWIEIAQLDSVTLSGPHRRWITALLARTPAP